jgi:hypothetical protein
MLAFYFARQTNNPNHWMRRTLSYPTTGHVCTLPRVGVPLPRVVFGPCVYVVLRTQPRVLVGDIMLVVGDFENRMIRVR